LNAIVCLYVGKRLSIPALLKMISVWRGRGILKE
jgi:hypothetical protein